MNEPPPERRAEQELVDDASRGDRTAVELLLERHVAGLRAYLGRHADAAILKQESVSDLAQSVCREALQHLADERFEYQGEAEFKQWLYQAALLKVKDRRRYYGAAKRRSPGRVITDQTSSPGLEEFFRTMTTPSGEAADREEIDVLAATFSELPEAQRQIIELARIQGRSHQEIAVQLGVTEAHSRMLLSRAMARLASAARRRLKE